MASIDAFFTSGSRILIKLVVVCFAFVLVIQTLLYYKPFPLSISLAEKIEGEKIANDLSSIATEMDFEKNHIVLQVMNPYIYSLPKGKIMINDKLAGDFSKLNIIIDVRPGDLVALDFAEYSMEIIVKITPSEDLGIQEDIITVNKKFSLILPK